MGGVRYARHDGAVVPFACPTQNPDAEEALHPGPRRGPFRSPSLVTGCHPSAMQLARLCGAYPCPSRPPITITPEFTLASPRGYGCSFRHIRSRRNMLPQPGEECLGMDSQTWTRYTLLRVLELPFKA